MQQLNVETADDLKQQLTQFGDEFLFRGQTKHYSSIDGIPILNSSFIRKGCVPPLMLKWIFYVDELLRRGGFDQKRSDQSGITQGLLQHYGWRSFFVDLSASKSVAAWFASHVFELKQGLDLCENSFEEPVMLSVQRARYTESQTNGNFYVLNKRELERHGHTLVSLVDDLSVDCLTRFSAQKAWLASIFLNQTRLHPSAIVAHITAPATVFRELAKADGFAATNDLFPAPEEDAILRHLLSLPRIKLNRPGLMFPTYLRSLEIPEYQGSFVKHLPPSTVLARPFWPSEAIEQLQNGLSIRVDEETFYGSTDVGPMPHLIPYILNNPTVHVETENLICFPVVKGSNTYEKGIAIHRDDNGLYFIGSLGVDYVSDQLTGCGVAMGYSYRIENNSLTRVPTTQDCTCGDERKHYFHLRACAILDENLARGRVSQNGNIVTVSI